MSTNAKKLHCAGELRGEGAKGYEPATSILWKPYSFDLRSDTVLPKRHASSAGRPRKTVPGHATARKAAEHCLMPRPKRAVRYAGRCPAHPARGTPPETPGPLSLLPQLPERSSPSRVRYGKSFHRRKRFSSAAHTSRALDCSGPFRTPPHIRESGLPSRRLTSAPAGRLFTSSLSRLFYFSSQNTYLKTLTKRKKCLRCARYDVYTMCQS